MALKRCCAPSFVGTRAHACFHFSLTRSLIIRPAAEADAGEKRTAEAPAAEEPASKTAKAEEAVQAPAAEEAKPVDVAPVEAAAPVEAEAPLKSGPVAVDDAPKGTPTPVIV